MEEVALLLVEYLCLLLVFSFLSSPFSYHLVQAFTVVFQVLE